MTPLSFLFPRNRQGEIQGYLTFSRADEIVQALLDKSDPTANEIMALLPEREQNVFFGEVDLKQIQEIRKLEQNLKEVKSSLMPFQEENDYGSYNDPHHPKEMADDFYAGLCISIEHLATLSNLLRSTSTIDAKLSSKIHLIVNELPSSVAQKVRSCLPTISKKTVGAGYIARSKGKKLDALLKVKENE